MLELREKEVEIKIKKIKLSKIENPGKVKTTQQSSDVVLKVNRPPKSKIKLDKSIESDDFANLP